MSKEKNDLFVVILFTIIWTVRPISYDEMRSRHPIYPQENVVVVNSSSISNQNDEFDFLESTTKEIILAKDTSGNFFAEGFTPLLPRRPTSTGSQTPMGMGGSNPGQGGNPGSASEAVNSSSNLPDPNPKIVARIDDQSYNKKKKANKKKYSQIMDELENQKDQKVVVVKIGDKTYTLNNPYKDGADELQYKLAEKLYNDCRKDNKDVSEIAEKNTLKKENVQKCKDHIFNNEHLLDQYEELGEPAEYKKFDPNLKQALAWERFKDGIPTKEDIEWLRHEFVEQAYESKNNAGYRDSHKYAQNRYNGDPWIEEWDN